MNYKKLGIVITTHGYNGIYVRQCINCFLKFFPNAYIILFVNESKDKITFESLKKGYLAGMPKTFTINEKESAKKLFKVLAKEGGNKLVGTSKTLENGTFWDFQPNIKW